MTRTYATRRLLEHGPLTFGELVAITGWTQHSARAALANLQMTGTVTAIAAQARNKRLHVYALTTQQSST